MFILDNNGGNWRANMTQMPEARLSWALVDTQGVAIVLSPPNLIGPLASGPGTLGEAVPHPAGGARRCEDRPASASVIELLFSGLNSRGDRWSVVRLNLLNHRVCESRSCDCNGARFFDEPASGLPRELSLLDLQRVVLSLEICCPLLIAAG